MLGGTWSGRGRENVCVYDGVVRWEEGVTTDYVLLSKRTDVGRAIDVLHVDLARLLTRSSMVGWSRLVHTGSKFRYELDAKLAW